MTGLTTKSNIAQLIFASVPSGSSIAYIDNVLFSKVAVGIESEKTVNVNVYPNLSNDILNITTDKKIENIEIYNSLGQVVLARNINANFAKLSIIELPKGIYTLKASINGVETFNKVVKE